MEEWVYSEADDPHRPPPIYKRPFRVIYSLVFYFFGYILYTNLIHNFIPESLPFDYSPMGLGMIYGTIFSDVLSILEDYIVGSKKYEIGSMKITIDRWILIGIITLFATFLDWNFRVPQVLFYSIDGFSKTIFAHPLIYHVLITFIPYLDRRFRQRTPEPPPETSPFEYNIPFVVCILSLTISAIIVYFQAQVVESFISLLLTLLMTFIICAISSSIILLAITKKVRNRQTWTII
jgi:hypothetical protein